MKSLSKTSMKELLKEDNRENERIIKCGIILFDILFVSSAEENMIEKCEIINECNVSIEREQKIILVKKISFLLRAMMFKAEFQKLLFINGIYCFSISL